MADIKFACPQCNQHITCDELWGGHELQCPSCQQTLTVPGAAAPAPAPAPASLAPQPPAGGAPKVSLSYTGGRSAAQQPAPQQRAIPIRNLTAPPPKKANPALKIVTTVVVVAGLGVGGYFGFIWLKGMQDKANAKSRTEEAKSSGESQVGHIANLNSVLDATEPGHIGESRGRPAGPKARSSGIGEEVPVAPEPGANTAAALEKQLPVVPASWTLDLPLAKIPEGKVNGMISGTNFVADLSRVDPSATAQVLRFIQGLPASPDREMLVYLHLKPGEKLGGQTLNISSDMRGSGVPTVAKRWKTNPKFAPTQKYFSSGYAMKLELGVLTNGVLPGKLFLALPDTEQSVAAGVFMASATVPEPGMQPAAAATPAPAAVPSAAADAYRKRYGGR